MYIMRKRPEAEMRAFGEDANTVVFGTVVNGADSHSPETTCVTASESKA